MSRAFTATFVALLWVLLLLTAPARAVPCGIGSYYVDAQDSDQQYGSRSAENLVIDPAATCALVRSVYIWRTGSNFVEVGWFQNGTDGAILGCQDYVRPHVFAHAFVDGEAMCKQNPPLLPLDPDPVYSMRVDNPDHDFDFVYYWDDDTTPSTSLGFFATLHKAGYPIMATERHHSSDSLRADLDGVNSLGGGGQWHQFPLSALHSNGNVSGYSVCSWSGEHLLVKASC